MVKISIFISASLLMVSCHSGDDKQNNKKEIPPVPVEILLAGKSKFPSTIEINGNILPMEMVELHPEVNGRITYLNMPDGKEVAAGTILVKLNDAELQAQLQQQSVQLELAKKTEQRLQKLLAINGVDQAAYDAALSQMNALEAACKVLKAQIDKTIIKAPFHGHLGIRTISEGAYVSTSSILGSITQSDKIKLDFNVPETYLPLVKIGKTVTFMCANSMQTATITAVEPQINTISRNIKVRAMLNGGTCSSGSFAKVMLEDENERFLVPTQAIIPDAFSNQIICIKNGKAQFKKVETGLRNTSLVEITKGIESGDSIVISGILFIRPNSVLKIKSCKNMDQFSTPEPK